MRGQLSPNAANPAVERDGLRASTLERSSNFGFVGRVKSSGFIALPSTSRTSGVEFKGLASGVISFQCR